jgi:hypothetical protein
VPWVFSNTLTSSQGKVIRRFLFPDLSSNFWKEKHKGRHTWSRTAYPSCTSEHIPFVVGVIRVAQSLAFRVVFVCLFCCPFSLVIIFPVFHLPTTSDYPLISSYFYYRMIKIGLNVYSGKKKVYTLLYININLLFCKYSIIILNVSLGNC